MGDRVILHSDINCCYASIEHLHHPELAGKPLAVGEGVNKAVDVSVIQCFVAMGSNCVPIPGAMGVADYIMIDGFKQLVGKNAANMELLCRGMTFYGSVITSAVIILIGYIIRKKRAK